MTALRHRILSILLENFNKYGPLSFLDVTDYRNAQGPEAFDLEMRKLRAETLVVEIRSPDEITSYSLNPARKPDIEKELQGWGHRSVTLTHWLIAVLVAIAAIVVTIVINPMLKP